ncbi:MAG: hypothetical protein ACK5LJ_09810 [Paracoccus sp. (in: a-proteobacteria)]
MAIHCHTTGALPVARLHEIHDMLTLALDASESPVGYTQSEREARSYIRSAQRSVGAMMEGRV